ncbi:uncharacterized protein [Lolium perenne]|uniref:uncharacterized protein isoform X2 n=1 Tax=Lolium perenne TaxID=4522 RepID=UPI0021F52704|nr:protein STRUBBELIG-RECEPTOR FAMILY 4-like isoform X2 [Lolium perenne]
MRSGCGNYIAHWSRHGSFLGGHSWVVTPVAETGNLDRGGGVFCKDSCVVAINISGLGVGGWLGPELLKLHSLKELDVSFNNIAGEIPPTLPPNVEYLNLAANKFEGTVPPSLPYLHSLKYMNFNEECLIGEGITGRVYRGDFPDGQGRTFLFSHATFKKSTRSRALSWKARMKISLGVAYALEYLHFMCSPPVTHGNIEATNILLDAQLMPYLSHCGLGKFSHFVSATRMVQF